MVRRSIDSTIHLGLEYDRTGTHVGCGEGGCGICTVALVLPTGETLPINSCLRRLAAVDGCHIINTQGLGTVKDGKLHALQKAIADGNGSQCGFCTPGWVMNMYSLLQKTPKPSAAAIEQQFDGNLCRCTGRDDLSFVSHMHGNARAS